MTTSPDSILPAAAPAAAAGVESDSNRLDAAGAELVGWLVVAAINQLLIAAISFPASTEVRLLHHAYDAGQMLAAGVVSFGAVKLGQACLRKLAWPRRGALFPALATALVGLLVSLATVRGDVDNAAGRYGLPVWAAVLAASTVLGAALGATVLLRHQHRRWLRGSVFLAGLAGCIVNAFVLTGDYPAFHLMVAWFSAVFIAHSVEGVLPGARLGRVGGTSAFVLLAALGAVALAVPPRQEVLRRLYSLSSTSLAPFIARLYPASPGPVLELVPREYLQSPWFQDRTRMPDAPPTRRLVLPEPKLVLLLTVDAMRADVIAKEEHLQKLPAFKKLRDSSAYFAQARTAATSTRASIGSLMAGRFFTQIHWGRRDGLSYLEDAAPRIPDLLSGAGIKTISFPRLHRTSKLSGVGRGFQTEIRKLFTADKLVKQIIEHVDGLRAPTFLFAHFGEPHAPYEGEGRLFERYLQEIARVDRALLRLVEFLETSGLAERTLLIVTSDHGEGFGEHGMFNHARIIYEEAARIPLLIHGPGVVPREIAEPVTLVDLAPTILDVFGLATPGLYAGQTLAPLLVGQDVRLERPIAVEATRGAQALYLPDGKKVIIDVIGRTVEVYELRQDPGETRNLIGSARRDVAVAVEIARLFFQANQQVHWEDEVGGDD